MAELGLGVKRFEGESLRLHREAHDPPVIVVTYVRHGEAVLGVMLPYASPEQR